MVRSANAGPNHTTPHLISNEINFSLGTTVPNGRLCGCRSGTPLPCLLCSLVLGGDMLIRVEIVDLNWEGKNLTEKEKLDLTRKVEKSYVSFDDDLTDDEISDKLHDLIKQQTKCEADLISWFPVDDPIFIL